MLLLTKVAIMENETRRGLLFYEKNAVLQADFLINCVTLIRYNKHFT